MGEVAELLKMLVKEVQQIRNSAQSSESTTPRSDLWSIKNI